jgi:hypothetical protein
MHHLLEDLRRTPPLWLLLLSADSFCSIVTWASS